MTENNESGFFEMLVESLQLVALDYEEQIGILPDFVHVPDELALTYYDCFLLADQIERAHLITRLQFEILKDLDYFF